MKIGIAVLFLILLSACALNNKEDNINDKNKKNGDGVKNLQSRQNEEKKHNPKKNPTKTTFTPESLLSQAKFKKIYTAGNTKRNKENINQIKDKEIIAISPNDKNCLIRAMYFESERNSYDGLLAVGTVVLNRLNHRSFPSTICSVVGQKYQFASGVLTRHVDPKQSKMAIQVAEDIIQGKRHQGTQKALFFHTKGFKLPWKNMKFAAIAGGNVFYQDLSKKLPSENL